MTTPKNTPAEDTATTSDRTAPFFSSAFEPMFAAYDEEFRAAVAERGTPRANALYAVLQAASQQGLGSKSHRCNGQHNRG